MFQFFRKNKEKEKQHLIYYCSHKPIIGKSMKGYVWDYFEKFVLPSELKRNPYKFHYYLIEGTDIHPDFWKNHISTVLRVSNFQEIDIPKEIREPYLKV